MGSSGTADSNVHSGKDICRKGSQLVLGRWSKKKYTDIRKEFTLFLYHSTSDFGWLYRLPAFVIPRILGYFG